MGVLVCGHWMGHWTKKDIPLGFPGPISGFQNGSTYSYITLRYTSTDMHICASKPRVGYLKLTAGDVALLELLESRGLLREWDGDAKLVGVAPRIREVESTDDDVDLENDQSSLGDEESGSEDEDFYSADEDYEGQVEQNLGLRN